MKRVACGVLVAALSLATADVACNRKPEINFSLRVPSAVLDQVAWYEIAAYPDATCPSSAEFAGGVPVYGAAARVSFSRNAKVPPGLGDLKTGSYAFAATAKAEDCGVLAVGCTVADVGDTSDVTITLRQTDPPTGACSNGTVCQNAQCVPSGDNSDPSIGAGCSLQLLGAGPLGNPLGLSGTIMSNPAIVPVTNGFLIAYREFDSLGGQARLVFIPVDTGGGAQGIVTETLPDRCAGSEESDALGMAFSGDTGLVVVARQPCNGTAGFDFYAVGEDGKVAKSGRETNPQLASSQLALSPAHALAPSPTAGGGYWLAWVKDAQAILNTTTDVHFSTSPAVTFPPGTPSPASNNAWVVTTDKLVALLAGGSGAGTVVPPFDAGAGDAGKDAGPAPVPDAGVVPTMRLSMATPQADLTRLQPAFEFPGSWASMSAQGGRLVVASSGSTPGKPVAFRVFDIGVRDPKVTDGFNTEGLGKVTFADVAFNTAGRIFFAVEQPASIALVAYDKAGTDNPVFLREVQLGSNPRVPSLKDVRDGRIAIAASDTRVAIVWATAKQLTTNDPTGGYAVFACR